MEEFHSTIFFTILQNLDFARSYMIIYNPYWIIKCPDVPLSLSFPRSFDHGGFCDVKSHVFDTNVCFKPLIQAFRDTRSAESCPGLASQSVYKLKKSCPAFQGYPTCRGETTRPPELSCSLRQLGDIHLNGCLNFTTTQGKVNSHRVTRGQGCFGYPRPHKRGRNLAGPLWWSRDASRWSEEILLLWATLNKNVNQAPQIFPPSIRLDDNEMSSRMKN